MMSNVAANENRPIFILYLIYGFRIGGAERHLLDLCKGLDRRRFRPEIIYFHRDEQMLDEFRHACIPCSIFPATAGELCCTEILRLSRIIKKLSPDIVHVHLFHASRFGAMAAYMAGMKLIVRTKHNVSDPEARHGKKDRIWRALYPLMLERTVAVSKAIAREIDSPYVIYNGVDTDYFDPGTIDQDCRKECVKKFQVEGSPLLGIAARLTKQKGHPVLIRAFSQLLRDWPDARLLIAGDGEERSTLEILTSDLGLCEKVIFLGPIRNVREFLSILDMFVHPSIFEGLGIAVIEAMSMGLPIVATRVDGLCELISDGVEGLLVEHSNPGELCQAMNRILGNPALGAKLGSQARTKAVDQFSLKTMVQKYQELYLDMCR